jgi:hypothetical protein
MALPNEARDSRTRIAYSAAAQSDLARDVERRLAPAAPRLRRKVRLRAMVATAAFLWLLGLGGAMAGAMMASEGFRVDALEQQLTTAQREQQRLAGLVAAATTSQALSQDAQKLGVPVTTWTVAMPKPVPTRPAPQGLWARLVARVDRYWRQVKQWEAGPPRP